MNVEQKKIILISQTPEGVREIALEDGELRIGRGDVAVRFADNNLSRHHATIFRNGDRIWVLDENSTNGTFVNDTETASNGTILQDGDEIRLGSETILKLKFVKPQAFSNKPKAAAVNQNTSAALPIVPMIVAGIAIFVIGLAVIVVASRSFGTSEPEIVSTTHDEIDDEDRDEPDNTNRKKPKTETTPTVSGGNSNAETPQEKTEDSPTSNKQIPVIPTKTYLTMSDSERRQFIDKEAHIVAQMVGNRSGGAIPPEAIERIKSFVDGYAKRLRSKRKDDCSEGGWVSSDLLTVIERASKNAQFIVPAFNSEGIPPQIGLYLAMIESEHCVCLQSPTGPLGMFQFTKATGASFGLAVKAGASPTNPDERCEPEKAAPAAAKYMKFLTGRYGTGALSVPLAIASYNSGEGGLSKNLNVALGAEDNQERSFWTLVANQGKLSAQFQKENIKYVPKFFAAAIIGENPSVFGVNKPPISSNTK